MASSEDESSVRQRYWKIVDLPPTVLGPDDLVELESVLADGVREPRVEVEAKIDDAAVSASSVEALLAIGDLPETTDRVTIKVMSGDLQRSTNVTMYYNYVTYHVTSDEATWFYGKQEQLRRFFRQHRPWYWRGKVGWSHFVIGGILAGCLLGASVLVAIAIRDDPLFALGLLAPASGLFAAYALTSHRMLPYVRVDLRKRKPRFSHDTASMLIAAATLGVAVLGTAVTVLAALT